MVLFAVITVVFLATFAAAGAALIVTWVILERRFPSPERAPEGLAFGPEGRPLLLKQDVLSTISIWARLLARFDFVQRMKDRISEAGLSWSVGRVTLSMLLLGAVALLFLSNLESLPGVVVLAAACLAASAPYLYILRRRASRLARFEEQFPDGLDYLARALRAGHPLAASLEMLAAESAAPLSVEIRKTFDERQLGLSWEQALDNLAVRVPIIDVSYFVAAVALQNRTGGRLGDVLARLAETMRERAALRGEIRAISAHGRLTGLILTLIPLVVAGLMAVVNPAYLGLLLDHPHGKDLLLAAAAFLAVAHLIIRRIVEVRL